MKKSLSITKWMFKGIEQSYNNIAIKTIKIQIISYTYFVNKYFSLHEWKQTSFSAIINGKCLVKCLEVCCLEKWGSKRSLISDINK